MTAYSSPTVIQITVGEEWSTVRPERDPSVLPAHIEHGLHCNSV